VHGCRCHFPIYACFLLALRSISMLLGIGQVMKPNARDSGDVLTRAFMESRDLLMNFRFDDQGTRNKIKRWFDGGTDNTWLAEHKRCERFMKQLSGSDTELGRRWSMFSAISHPTVHAARHSTAMVVSRVTGRVKIEDFAATMQPKIVDYLTSISRLILITTSDLPGWVPLNCDLSRMLHVGTFQALVDEVVAPLLDLTKDNTLPKGSFRSG
jgi:hypothetical protein